MGSSSSLEVCCGDELGEGSSPTGCCCDLAELGGVMMLLGGGCSGLDDERRPRCGFR